MPISQPILQQYQGKLPSTQNLVVALSLSMELNVIDLINPKTWDEQLNARSTLYRIFASDTSQFDQKNKNLLALLVINTIWAEHFMVCSEIKANKMPKAVKADLLDDIQRAAELANDSHTTAFGHYVAATIHRSYSEFHHSIAAAKQAKIELEKAVEPSRFSVFQGHILNQLGLAECRAGLLRDADATLFMALEHVDPVNLNRENLSAEMLINYSENNLSYRTNMNLSQVHTNLARQEPQLAQVHASIAFQYAKIAYFSYATYMRPVDQAYCLTVLAESLVCALKDHNTFDKIPSDVTEVLPQVLADLNKQKTEYEERSPANNDNVLRFYITSLDLHYRLYCLNPSMVTVESMSELRGKLSTMDTNTKDLQDKQSRILKLTESTLEASSTAIVTENTFESSGMRPQI